MQLYISIWGNNECWEDLLVSSNICICVFVFKCVSVSVYCLFVFICIWGNNEWGEDLPVSSNICICVFIFKCLSVSVFFLFVFICIWGNNEWGEDLPVSSGSQDGKVSFRRLCISHLLIFVLQCISHICNSYLHISLLLITSFCFCVPLYLSYCHCVLICTSLCSCTNPYDIFLSIVFLCITLFHIFIYNLCTFHIPIFFTLSFWLHQRESVAWWNWQSPTCNKKERESPDAEPWALKTASVHLAPMPMAGLHGAFLVLRSWFLHNCSKMYMFWDLGILSAGMHHVRGGRSEK